MKLTRASSYALHAVSYLAGLKKDYPVASHIIEARLPKVSARPMVFPATAPTAPLGVARRR